MCCILRKCSILHPSIFKYYVSCMISTVYKKIFCKNWVGIGISGCKKHWSNVRTDDAQCGLVPYHWHLTWCSSISPHHWSWNIYWLQWCSGMWPGLDCIEYPHLSFFQPVIPISAQFLRDFLTCMRSFSVIYKYLYVIIPMLHLY